jgi:ubiquinone/menaquinone biosynthesis C-methylase UbiE
MTGIDESDNRMFEVRKMVIAMQNQVMGAQEFYTREADFKYQLDPAWDDEEWQSQMQQELEILAGALGQASDQSVLDCSCGSGGQAISLAKLGWQVTAADLSDSSLKLASQRAQREKVNINFRVCDMRDLHRTFQPSFDWVISCMALDNLTTDDDIGRAVKGMHEILKPGGRCYIRLRDFDHLMEVKPRYEFKGERSVPHGRVIRLEDWNYESEQHVIYIIIYLWEDYRKTGYRWTTDIFSIRRRALRKAKLKQFLMATGFREIVFLSQPTPWHPYEVVATS